MSYRLVLSIPVLPAMNTAATRRHWTAGARAAKQWTTLVAAHLAGRRPPAPLPRSRVTLVRLSSTVPDYDNLVMSFKPVLDALVKLDVLADDGPTYVERVYRWERARPKRGMIGIEVVELLDDAVRGLRILAGTPEER